MEIHLMNYRQALHHPYYLNHLIKLLEILLSVACSPKAYLFFAAFRSCQPNNIRGQLCLPQTLVE